MSQVEGANQFAVTLNWKNVHEEENRKDINMNVLPCHVRRRSRRQQGLGLVRITHSGKPIQVTDTSTMFL